MKKIRSVQTLTTYDLYERPGYSFEIHDLVKFKLLKEYKLRIFNDDFKRGIVEKSANKNSNQSKFRKNSYSFVNRSLPNETITGTIMDYTPCERNDLEIELIRNDGYEISLKLSQCKDLRIL